MPSTGKTVFITGCDTGLGAATAIELDKQGYKVIAACLTTNGATQLQQSSSTITTVQCDVTKEEDVCAAVKVVEKQCPEGLWAVVNNAGK